MVCCVQHISLRLTLGQMRNFEDNFFSQVTVSFHATYITEVLYSFYNLTIIFHHKYTTTKVEVSQGHQYKHTSYNMNFITSLSQAWHVIGPRISTRWKWHESIVN